MYTLINILAQRKCTCFHIARRPTLWSRYILFTRFCGELSRNFLVIVCNFSLHYRGGIARNSAAFCGGKTRWFSEDFLLRVSGKFLLQISAKFLLTRNKSSADTANLCFPPVQYCTSISVYRYFCYFDIKIESRERISYLVRLFMSNLILSDHLSGQRWSVQRDTHR